MKHSLLSCLACLTSRPTVVKLKDQREIELMAASGRIVGQVLQQLGQAVEPGISTGQLDQLARRLIEDAGAIPSFLGYGRPPFPGAICASIDQEVVHGIPDDQRILQAGSIISIDVGVLLDGYHADAARTFAVGQVQQEVLALVRVTRECFWLACQKAHPGRRLGDLSATIQAHAEAHGYGVVRELTGHGIGQDLHEDPDLPNYGTAGRGLRLEPGLVLAMEPMINQGGSAIQLKADGWTIVTADGLPSAHYENTFVVTQEGPRVLTLEPGEEDETHRS